MKKILNKPVDYVAETLEGLVAAHGDALASVGNSGRVIGRRQRAKRGKVGLVTGGGSGHLPLFLGYVGEGLLDACAVGDVFSSPNVEQMLDAIREANTGAGVLALYGNYSGDKLNFGMAMELAESEGIPVKAVTMTDDVASAPSTERQKRRGVAGLVYLYKIVGAAAVQGCSLQEAHRIAEKVVGVTRTMGVALTPCTVPAVGHPTFSLADSEMEIGMGIHGEPGIRRTEILTADAVAQVLLDGLSADLGLRSSERVSVLVNSLGATPLEELYIVYRFLHRELSRHGVAVAKPVIGRFATSMEMSGLSVTLIRLDGELERLLAFPCESPFWSLK